jgi:hypothetical protein
MLVVSQATGIREWLVHAASPFGWCFASVLSATSQIALIVGMSAMEPDEQVIAD